MLFYTLILFYLIRVVLNMEPASSSSQNTLEKTVNTFYFDFTLIHMYPEFKPVFPPKLHSTSWVIELNFLTIQRSVENLEYVFQQLKDKRIGELRSETILSDRHNLYIPAVELMICSYTTRYLDFIYVSTNKIDQVLKLHQWNSIMCDSWTNLVYSYGQCKVLEQQSNILICRRNIVNALINLMEDSLYENKYNMPNEKINIINPRSVTYISEMYGVINGINIMKIIEQRSRYVYNNMFCNLHYGNVETIVASSSTAPDIRRPTNNPDSVYSKQLEEFKRGYVYNMNINCKNYLTNTDNIMVYGTSTYLVLVKTYNRLQTIFQNQLHSQYIHLLQRNQECVAKTFVEALINLFHKEVCEHAPLLISHFYSDNITNTGLISIYMVMCSGDMHFIQSRCSSDNGESYNVKCLLHSLNQRMFVNSNYIPLMRAIKNKMIDEENQDHCIKQMTTYIKTIYNSVVNYREKNHYQVPLWTTYKWISGQNLLTMKSESPIMNEFKYNKMKFGGSSSIPLLAVYQQMLPWSLSCINAIMIFHYQILYNLDRTMNLFLYRQVKLISMYFELTNADQKPLQFERVKKSYDWYTAVTGVFRLFLNLSFTYKPDERAAFIMNLIQNYKINDSLLDIILQHIPQEEERNLRLDSTGEEGIHTIAYLNCKRGLIFMDEFIKIAKESILMIDHIIPNFDANYSNSCMIDVRNFFSVLN